MRLAGYGFLDALTEACTVNRGFATVIDLLAHRRFINEMRKHSRAILVRLSFFVALDWTVVLGDSSDEADGRLVRGSSCFVAWLHVDVSAVQRPVAEVVA